MKDYIKISDFSELQKLIDEKGKLLIFKHSTRCPISSKALREYENFLASDPQLLCIYIDVIEDRSVSLEIERSLQVKHESPQAILIEDSKVKWTASHSEISAQTLNEAANCN